MDSQKFFRYAMTCIVIMIIATVSIGTYLTSKRGHQEQSYQKVKQEDSEYAGHNKYSTKEGIIEGKSVVAVDNEAFMELSYMISQENILGMMRLEQEGKIFKLRYPARCTYSDAIMYDGVVVVTIEDGEYALKSGLTWKTFIR